MKEMLWIQEAKKVVGGDFLYLLERFEDIESTEVNHEQYNEISKEIQTFVNEVVANIKGISSKGEKVKSNNAKKRVQNIIGNLERLGSIQLKLKYFSDRINILCNTMASSELMLMYHSASLRAKEKPHPRSEDEIEMWNFFEGLMVDHATAEEFKRLWNIYKKMNIVAYAPEHTEQIYTALMSIYTICLFGSRYDEIYEVEEQMLRGYNITSSAYMPSGSAHKVAIETLAWYDKMYPTNTQGITYEVKIEKTEE